MQPTNDTTGLKDTYNLLWELANKKHIVLELGNYYFTKLPTSYLSIIPIEQDGVTIDGQDWNSCTLYMVGEEGSEQADWYLFHLVNRKGFTARNLTIDGTLLNTIAEQTHGFVATNPVDMLFQNVRGQYIFGDTAKIGYSVSNVRFVDTEHIGNGRSGIAMRGDIDTRPNTGGGLTIRGFLARDISDQAIDMEPGFTPGEVIIADARIYGRENMQGLCLTLNGGETLEAPAARLLMSNVQVYGRVGLYNLKEAVINNCLFDSTGMDGVCMDVRKGCEDVAIGNSIVKGRASDALISMSVYSSGRPNCVHLNNLRMHVANEVDGTGCAVSAYDCQNVSMDNIAVTSDKRLSHAIGKRDVTAGVNRGYFAVNGLRVNNANYGVHVANTSNGGSTITDTFSVQNSHFGNVGTAVIVYDPEPNHGRYINSWDFSGNVYGENVTNEVVMGSVFE